MKKLNRPAPGPAGTWCTNSRKALLLRSLCTKSQARFAPWPAGTWCTKPRKALFLRYLCTKFQAIFGAGPAGTWCTNPRKALFFRSLCTKSQDIFGAGPAGTWCTNSRKALFFRSRCTKFQARFDIRAAGTWCTKPRKPLFFRSLCTKSQIRFAPQPAMLAPGSSQSHIPPSGHANTDAVFPALGRPSWRLVPRKAFVFRQATPTPAPFSCRRCLGPGRRGARRRRNKGLRGAAHHVLPANLPRARAPGHRAPLHSHRPPGLFLRLCFSSIYKKGIMKWPDWRAADSGKGKGREASNL